MGGERLPVLQTHDLKHDTTFGNNLGLTEVASFTLSSASSESSSVVVVSESDNPSELKYESELVSIELSSDESVEQMSDDSNSELQSEPDEFDEHDSGETDGLEDF